MPPSKRAGVIGRVALRNSLLGFSKAALQRQKDSAETAAHIAGIIAKDVGQATIATTPSSLKPGKVGRIWTGAMYDGFDSSVTKTGNSITLKFGWLKQKKGYYKIQEYGGFAFGKTVTPMHALVNSLVASQDYLKSRGIK